MLETKHATNPSPQLLQYFATICQQNVTVAPIWWRPMGLWAMGCFPSRVYNLKRFIHQIDTNLHGKESPPIPLIQSVKSPLWLKSNHWNPQGFASVASSSTEKSSVPSLPLNDASLEDIPSEAEYTSEPDDLEHLPLDHNKQSNVQQLCNPAHPEDMKNASLINRTVKGYLARKYGIFITPATQGNTTEPHFANAADPPATVEASAYDYHPATAVPPTVLAQFLIPHVRLFRTRSTTTSTGTGISHSAVHSKNSRVPFNSLSRRTQTSSLSAASHMRSQATALEHQQIADILQTNTAANSGAIELVQELS